MDQNSQPTNNQPAPQASPNLPPLIPAEQAQALFTELHLQNLPADKKEEMLDTMIDTVMDRIFLRVEPLLSPEIQQRLDELSARPESDQEIAQLLTANVPDLDKIAQEEINSYREGLKLQINTVIKTLDEEASKTGSPIGSGMTDESGGASINPFEGVAAQPAPEPVVSAPQTVVAADSSQVADALGATSSIQTSAGAEIVQPQ